MFFGWFEKNADTIIQLLSGLTFDEIEQLIKKFVANSYKLMNNPKYEEQLDKINKSLKSIIFDLKLLHTDVHNKINRINFASFILKIFYIMLYF